MRKKGFTLIEIICVLAIFSVFAATTMTIIKPMIKISKEQEAQTVVYLTEDLLCYGKLYSKYNETYLNGVIDKNKIYIYASGFSRTYELPKGYEYYTSNSKKTFKINSKGEIDISTTIYLKFEGENVAGISITVGSETLNVK